MQVSCRELLELVQTRKDSFPPFVPGCSAGCVLEYDIPLLKIDFVSDIVLVKREQLASCEITRFYIKACRAHVREQRWERGSRSWLLHHAG